MATRMTTKIIERDATTAAVDLSVNTNSEKKNRKCFEMSEVMCLIKCIKITEIHFFALNQCI